MEANRQSHWLGLNRTRVLGWEASAPLALEFGFQSLALQLQFLLLPLQALGLPPQKILVTSFSLSTFNLKSCTLSIESLPLLCQPPSS